MLILSRKETEQIEINGGAKEGGVSIHVMRISPGKVSIGVEAADDVRIVRSELEYHGENDE